LQGNGTFVRFIMTRKEAMKSFKVVNPVVGGWRFETRKDNPGLFNTQRGAENPKGQKPGTGSNNGQNQSSNR